MNKDVFTIEYSLEHGIRHVIRQMMTANQIIRRRTSNIVLSNITYELLRKEMNEDVGVPGDITMYMGMSIVVLDTEELILLVG